MRGVPCISSDACGLPEANRYISPISALYLPYICPISPLYLPYISPISPLYLPEANRNAHLVVPTSLSYDYARGTPPSPRTHTH